MGGRFFGGWRVGRKGHCKLSSSSGPMIYVLTTGASNITAVSPNNDTHVITVKSWAPLRYIFCLGGSPAAIGVLAGAGFSFGGSTEDRIHFPASVAVGRTQSLRCPVIPGASVLPPPGSALSPAARGRSHRRDASSPSLVPRTSPEQPT